MKEKGNAHTTEYEKNTPVETQGFYVYFFLPKKIDFLLDSFYTIYRLAFYYERYTNERKKGFLPFDLEK